MESDSVKRSSSLKVTKPAPVSTAVEGTSVTPRQRPKGQNLTGGFINLGGQIVSQISGQGNQQSANSLPYGQVNRQITPVNTPQSTYSLQPGQSIGAVTPSGTQTLQLSAQSSFVPVSPHMTSPSQNITFGGPTPSQTFSQSQSPLISHSPLTQQSPVTVQDKSPYFFDSRSHAGEDANFEALFPVSGESKGLGFETKL